MKNLLIACFLALPFLSNSQTIGETNLDERKDIEYITLMPILEGKNPRAANWAIGVDLGFMQKDGFVKDAEGKHELFVSATGALNKFYGWGWELVSIYDLQNQKCYLMRRRK